MNSKEVTLSRSPKISPFLSFDKIFYMSGLIAVISVWFVWHVIFDLVLQVMLGMTILVLWFKNMQLKRNVNKLEGKTTGSVK
ncbi:hypothetical protein [Alkalimarinus alittae]|uniref:ATP synthase F0 subunit 8 n=1 Tax=Alkalimarinus alittae TaxID=2961619 RepID=A0ABY6N269_9ALTE|nr:hypothetical protein [Alkalimarinus alittae]UZE96186.1 hypothetical protein NKI27_00125 [Alkalimarinus alittae]